MTTSQFCLCEPCPGRGRDGHAMLHCAECCWGTLVVADPSCPVHGYEAYGFEVARPLTPSTAPVSGVSEG